VTVYYCDSSALVKGYVQEQGSAWMRTLLDPTAGHHLYLASITSVEVIAAVTRRLRRGDIAATDGAAAVAQFRQDVAQRYRLIDLTPPLIACVLDTFFCLGWFGPYRRLWPHNAIHFSEVH